MREIIIAWMFKFVCEYIGGDEHARALSGRGRLNSRVFSRVRSLCAQCGCVNHRKFNGRPSFRVPPGSFDAKYHVYVYYYTANRRLCMGVSPYSSVSYKNCVGALPPPSPPSIIVWGRLPPSDPPPPPGSAAYEIDRGHQYHNYDQSTPY